MSEPQPTTGVRPPLVAPLRHTIILIAILFGIAAYGAYVQATSHQGPHIVEKRGSALPLYLSLIAAEWGLVRFVTARGLRRTGTRLRDLIGARWSGWRDVLRDVALALGFWAIWTVASSVVARSLGPDTAKGIDTLLPRNAPEVVAWVLLSISAGFCEEVVFRGYLQTQFEALWGSASLAIAVQAVVFGISHGYQGVRNVIVITVLGVLYGALARWRRSLPPVMIAHAWTDIVSGLLARRV
jgi:membrane protease YdiL (CAAX protease family)